MLAKPLVYSGDDQPGYSRRRCGTGFSYRRANGGPVTEEERTRLESLAIPPAWRDVWICADPNGHIQATGIDARGRKQYRYHPLWRETRDQHKFELLCGFAELLPRIRRRFARDIENEPGTPEFALAAVGLLLDTVPMRIGNSIYASENGSYGASTLRKNHVKFLDGAVRFSFRAKGGKRVQRTVRDRRLHKIMEKVADLPGRHLFSYIGRDGIVHPVRSDAFNAYLAEAAGSEDVSAKMFRTWAGSLAAFDAAGKDVFAGARPTIKAMCEAAADVLSNTPAIARKSYVHPGIFGLSECEPDMSLGFFDCPPAHRRLTAMETRLEAYLARTA
ncbi:DNA topoisomerase IB [Tepidamorphus sp. 3E244]|uniref:DNA topoisomerase IB n=1 Tax=Tepidamorphus sp. 3E244 TaxID=3385498 RepID=UPI0038FC830B